MALKLFAGSGSINRVLIGCPKNQNSRDVYRAKGTNSAHGYVCGLPDECPIRLAVLGRILCVHPERLTSASMTPVA